MEVQAPIPRSSRIAEQGIQGLWRKLTAPRSTDEDRARREYILNVILLGSIAMLGILDASVLYYWLQMGTDYDGIRLSVFSIIPLFFMFLYAMSRKGYFISASYLLIATYLVSDSLAAYYWEVRRPEMLIGYVLIILISSILISTRFGFLITGLIAAFIIPVGYAQCNHLLSPKGAVHVNSSGSIVFAVLLFLVMVIAWLSNREIERSLDRARGSEKALKAERDNLETTVERRTQELGKAQFEKVEQIYRFAEFGQLASGIFHDILNLLNAMALRAEDAGGGNGADDDGGTLQETLHATKLIHGFMRAIRRQLDDHESRETFSLAESIDQAIQLVAYKAGMEKVRIMFKRDITDNAAYFGNPFKLHQVVINLLMNAIESYRGLPQDDPMRDRNVIIYLEKSQNIIRIRVEDHGGGIQKSAQARIFEPFFSTKEGPDGSGIGLATIKKIVEGDLKGTITFSTIEWQGTTFTVTLPLRTPPARKS